MFPLFKNPNCPQRGSCGFGPRSLHHFVLDNGAWLWPTLETLHFIGLSLLFATVGVFDLRVLGIGKAIPPGTLHRLIPIGIAGYALNVFTGMFFFSGFPEQYFYNAAFWWKGTFMAIAGINVAAFYLTRILPRSADASRRRRRAIPRQADRRNIARRVECRADLRTAADLLPPAVFSLRL